MVHSTKQTAIAWSLWWLLAALVLAGCPGQDADCSLDEHCPSGRYCRAGVCAYDCTNDIECPDGFRCSLRGECERGCRRTNNGIEACDGLDNDCDDQTDEDFADLGQACQFPPCPSGTWQCSQDGLAVECDARHPALDDSTCDGVDDDCDDETDEEVLEQPCPLQAGVCAGALRICETGGLWSECDYGPDHTPGVDDTCNFLDSDCDGQTDEDAALIPVGETGAEASDGLDNNCNGIVDEPGGVMVRIDDDYAIDAYEASIYDNPGCSGVRFGHPAEDYPAGFPAEGDLTTTLYACSNPDEFPSGFLSWYRASWACQAQGKRLCTADEYATACRGPELFRYPYGVAFYSRQCNDGWAEESTLAETGSYPACQSGSGAWDMSGNLGEWVLDGDSDNPGNSWVGGGYWACVICQPDGFCYDCNRELDGHKDNLMMALDCQPGTSFPTQNYESYARSRADSFLGTRCCMDLP